MKVITIGRSSQNEITINDPKVSRYHCQIVQHDDGSFSLSDFGSTNGTYVNGRRVYGEVRLNPKDVVRIGNTILPWNRTYPQPPAHVFPRKKTNALPIVLGGVGGVLVMAAIALFILMLKKDLKYEEVVYSGPEPPTCTITVEENGMSYEVNAVEGQLIVSFRETVSHKKAVEILNKNHAKIIAQMPDVQYYLVEVLSGNESDVFSKLCNVSEVDYVYPNAIKEICAVSSHVIDNFYKEHGNKVVSMMKGCFPLMDVETHDVNRGDGRYINTYQVHKEYKKIISNLGENESAVINFSFGPSLNPKKERCLWNDDEITNRDRANYVYMFSSDLKQYIKNTKRFDDKDFIVTISSGNEGLKGLEIVIENLRSMLSSKEYAVFERHFVLVSAKDDNKEGDYPNDVKNYNRMVTKVDISDMTAQDLHWQGTSFSSPRVAGFITSVANSYNMKVTEVLEHVRKATEKSPDHVLTQELLEKSIEKEKIVNEYQRIGCLKYRLVKDKSADMEYLELINTCDEDIRVTGYLLNTIAPHEGENTFDFETVVSAGGTEYVDGFVENKCTITRVEKVEMNLANRISSSSEQTSESQCALSKQSFYLKLKDDESYTLSDGTTLNASLTTMGIGDLWLKISWQGKTPLKIIWELNCYGLAPTSGELYAVKSYDTYSIHKTISDFQWVQPSADVYGVKLTVCPISENERKYAR